MPKKPFVHALAAAAYIIIIVSMIFVLEGRIPEQDNIFMPMGMLSLFTLSAALMGYIFLAEPLMLYIDGKKKEAASFFLKTVAFFAAFTGIVFVLMAFGFFPESGF